MGVFEAVGEYSHPTQVGIARCPGDSALTNEAYRSSAFAVELHEARAIVQAGGKDAIGLAVEYVISWGDISVSIQQDLEICLGKIASGKCTNYPISEN